MKKKIPDELKHDWQIQEATHSRTERWWCPNCTAWTGNLLKYKDEVCEAKERRKGEDRRNSK